WHNYRHIHPVATAGAAAWFFCDAAVVDAFRRDDAHRSNSSLDATNDLFESCPALCFDRTGSNIERRRRGGNLSKFTCVVGLYCRANGNQRFAFPQAAKLSLKECLNESFRRA